MDHYLLDSHKLYWHLDRVSQWQKARVVAPIYIEISPVSYCNHHCIFCAIDFAQSTPTQLDARVLCTRLKEMGKLGVRSVMFAGEGEPLLHKDIAAMVACAHRSGIDVSMTSNGSVGNPSVWKAILPHLTWIRFSLDAGSAEVYSAVHGVPQQMFERTLESVRSAVAVKKSMRLPVTIGVQYLLIDENIKYVDEAIRRYSSLGVDYISFKPYSLHPQMQRKKHVVYTPEVMRKVQTVIKRYTGKVQAQLIFRQFTMAQYMKGANQFCHCRSLPFFGHITSQGHFYTCMVFFGNKRFCVGNIYENNMKKIFFGPRRKASIRFAEQKLNVGTQCRLNCRTARVNEFLEMIAHEPEHVNFI